MRPSLSWQFSAETHHECLLAPRPWFLYREGKSLNFQSKIQKTIEGEWLLTALTTFGMIPMDPTCRSDGIKLPRKFCKASLKGQNRKELCPFPLPSRETKLFHLLLQSLHLIILKWSPTFYFWEYTSRDPWYLQGDLLPLLAFSPPMVTFLGLPAPAPPTAMLPGLSGKPVKKSYNLSWTSEKNWFNEKALTSPSILLSACWFA